MKILFITNKFYPDVGGIEVNSEVLAKHFKNEGHDIRLITWTKDKGDRVFPFTIIRNPSIVELLKQHFWAEFIYENNPCLRLSWPSIIFRRPNVVALRTWVSRLDGSMAIQDKLKLSYLKFSKSVIAVSSAVRDKCWPKAVVIGNPYRSDLFRVTNHEKRLKEFVFLGRLVSDKGANLAIEALNNLNEENKKYKLTIIGDGEDKVILEELVDKLKLNDFVTFTGILRGEALVECLNKHKFILVPSIWAEPFGNVALEGMACGCIPIVSNGGGLPDAVGKAGLVFKRGDLNDLISIIESVIDDLELQSQLKIRAKVHLKEHLPNVVARKYLDVIES
ncbi:glycosyl transferase group 1 [Tamlana sedimentorum]|uniref:Glycosyl transferase group 1 n=1 Tax=Neotamlana sedimentorum TaxID=1435349 RepID=A0A0D7W8A7_9FLAO|nr:glycosyltransferase family 4 protein [Tamlana sedimentorum]KJD34913.1 glycosyl transferase group 1 [Tamlana sedimentorum]